MKEYNKIINKYSIRKIKSGDEELLFNIWLNSVTATHHFISKEDIKELKISVKEALEKF